MQLYTTLPSSIKGSFLDQWRGRPATTRSGVFEDLVLSAGSRISGATRLFKPSPPFTIASAEADQVSAGEGRTSHIYAHFR